MPITADVNVSAVLALPTRLDEGVVTGRGNFPVTRNPFVLITASGVKVVTANPHRLTRGSYCDHFAGWRRRGRRWPYPPNSARTLLRKESAPRGITTLLAIRPA